MAGKLRGREPTVTPAQDREIRRMRDSGDDTIRAIVELFGFSRQTVYRSLARTNPEVAGQHEIPVPQKRRRRRPDHLPTHRYYSRALAVLVPAETLRQRIDECLIVGVVL